MKTTVRMIAKMANTSAATVSRYLSGAGSVNPKTAKRIDEAVLETGYTVKSGRERISTELSKMVMVISSDLSSQVFIDYYLGINDYLRSKDYHCVESYSNFDVDRIIGDLLYASANRFGGVVLLNISESPELIAALKKTTCPVIFVNRFLRSAEVDTVCVDNYQGGYAATKYLIDAGHKRIIHLSGITTSVVSQDRLLGFYDAMMDAKLAPEDKNIFNGDLTEDSGIRLGKKLVDGSLDCTAIFVANDKMAVGLANYLHTHGKRIPEDYSIIGFDTTPLAKNACVRLTTVSFNSYNMGLAAGEMLYNKMTASDPINMVPKKLVYPAAIDEGDSVSFRK